MLSIKQGDSFSLPIQFYDTTTQLGMTMSDEIRISSQIANTSGQIIATPTITKLAETGMILLEVPASITQHWKVGQALLDIKLIFESSVRHSQTIQFSIERSITR